MQYAVADLRVFSLATGISCPRELFPPNTRDSINPKCQKGRAHSAPKDLRLSKQPCSQYGSSQHGESTNTRSSSAMGLYSKRFHGLLTLCSECFSTFPHGTCSLSGLWIYLVLDRVYDLLSAACSNNATLGIRSCPLDFDINSHGSNTLHGALPSLVGTDQSWLT